MTCFTYIKLTHIRGLMWSAVVRSTELRQAHPLLEVVYLGILTRARSWGP